MKKTVWILAFFLAIPRTSMAFTALEGKEAKDYLGDVKSHLLNGQYTYEILKRSYRDAMNGRFSDATIFNADGGLFLYPRRKNGDHLMIIDSPDGREEAPVTQDAWRAEIENALSDDNPIPTVFLDDQKKEMAIVFIGKNTKLIPKQLPSGLLQIEIKVQGSSDSPRRRRGAL